jgi:hypothetical protein
MLFVVPLFDLLINYLSKGEACGYSFNNVQRIDGSNDYFLLLKDLM